MCEVKWTSLVAAFWSNQLTCRTEGKWSVDLNPQECKQIHSKEKLVLKGRLVIRIN